MSDRDSYAERWRRYRRSLYEMWFVLILWLAAGLYAVPVSFWLGYRTPPEEVSYPLGLGIPDWAFWGIVVPWLVCNVITVVLCFGILEDVPLEEIRPVRSSRTEPDRDAPPPSAR